MLGINFYQLKDILSIFQGKISPQLLFTAFCDFYGFLRPLKHRFRSEISSVTKLGMLIASLSILICRFYVAIIVEIEHSAPFVRTVSSSPLLNWSLTRKTQQVIYKVVFCVYGVGWPSFAFTLKNRTVQYF